jgi:hypothetical protein
MRIEFLAGTSNAFLTPAGALSARRHRTPSILPCWLIAGIRSLSLSPVGRKSSGVFGGLSWSQARRWMVWQPLECTGPQLPVRARLHGSWLPCRRILFKFRKKVHIEMGGRARIVNSVMACCAENQHSISQKPKISLALIHCSVWRLSWIPHRLAS